MVGFPGETADVFEHNYQFIARLPLAYMHVFRYSPRPQTKAALLANQVDEKLKKERSRIMRSLSQQKSIQFKQRYLGEVRPTLILNKPDAETGRLTGLTDNYLKTSVAADKDWIGKIVPLRISSLQQGILCGKVIASANPTPN